MSIFSPIVKKSQSLFLFYFFTLNSNLYSDFIEMCKKYSKVVNKGRVDDIKNSDSFRTVETEAKHKLKTEMISCL